MLDNRCRSRHIAFVSSSSCVVVVCCCQCWRVLVFIIQASFFFVICHFCLSFCRPTGFRPLFICLFPSVQPFSELVALFSVCFSLRGVHFRSILRQMTSRCYCQIMTRAKLVVCHFGQNIVWVGTLLFPFSWLSVGVLSVVVIWPRRYYVHIFSPADILLLFGFTRKEIEGEKK